MLKLATLATLLLGLAVVAVAGTAYGGQEHGESPVKPEVHGRTLVVECC